MSQITDYFNKPIADKYVIAVSWPDPRLDSMNEAPFIDAIKFAYLKGDVSEDSDLNGIARFKNLTVIGSSYNYTFVYFVCENAVSTLWSNKLTYVLKEMYIPM